MKEIVFRRVRENYGMMNYKIVVENGQIILIQNGETKIVILDKIPVKIYAKQGWLKSKDVTIDDSTTELTLKFEKIKSRITPWSSGLLILSLLTPKTIWGDSPITNTIAIAGLTTMAAWIIYAFVIKRNNWILIEKTTEV